MSEKVLDRIRKLLRLAADKGATQEEAESALLMAQRLMVEHGLNESQVEEAPTPEEMKIEEGVAEDIGRTESWRGRLGSVIADNFRCKSFWRQMRTAKPIRSLLVFLGHAGDVAIAKEVYQCATEVALREAGSYCRSRGRTGSRQDPEGRAMWNEFLIGFSVGLREKYRSQVQSNKWTLAIVTPEDVKRRAETLGLRSLNHNVSIGSPEAREAGREAGKAFVPARKISNNPKKTLLLKGE